MQTGYPTSFMCYFLDNQQDNLLFLIATTEVCIYNMYILSKKIKYVFF